jgi:mannobiose 2-epimerase
MLKKMGIRMASVLFGFGLLVPMTSAAQEQSREKQQTPPRITYLPATNENYRKFQDEAETMLRQDVLSVWFPRTVDNENGGFYSNFSRDWKPEPSTGKFSVFQGRMTWVASTISLRRPELKDQFLPIARHGLDYLKNVLWDKEDGGFYWGLQDNGKISPFYTDGKHLYGMSFALYGAAAEYQATHDPQALELCQRAFRWIDEHAHDAKNGGYFEWLTRDGKPIAGHPDTGMIERMPVAGFPIGYKSMNTHIHLLEAFAQLYEVWRDATLRSRLQELLAIIRDKVCVDPGAMNLYFTNDWRAFPDHDSYGHDVEAAYLMLEAEDVLGQGHDPKTERMAKMLVDHALTYGWDSTNGGFFREGTTGGKPEDKAKEWWVQFEGLNALLMMHERYGRSDDRYWKAFQHQWQFIRKFQIDPEFHGVYGTILPNGKPISPAKGEIWKAAYHDGRALLNVTERLRKLGETGVQ